MNERAYPDHIRYVRRQPKARDMPGDDHPARAASGSASRARYFMAVGLTTGGETDTEVATLPQTRT